MTSPYIIESARGLWWRMNAMVLAHTLGRPNSDGLYPILNAQGDIVRWYVRGEGFLERGKPW